MTTWLPVANLTATVHTLHDDDLAETTESALATLICLKKNTQRDSWNVSMWRGYPGGVWVYFLQACQELERRGADRKYYRELVQYGNVVSSGMDLRPVMPRWFGYRAVHLSHASTLIRERPTHYARCWPEVPLDMPMLWPVNKDGHFDFSIRIRRPDRELIVTGARVLPIAGDFLGRIR